MINIDSTLFQTKKLDITVEELRKVPGYENISEGEALKTLDSIKEFCLLFYETVISQENISK